MSFCLAVSTATECAVVSVYSITIIIQRNKFYILCVLTAAALVYYSKYASKLLYYLHFLLFKCLYTTSKVLNKANTNTISNVHKSIGF